MNFRIIPTVAALALAAIPAQAADPASVLAGLGISGTWALTCGQPPTPQSPHITFTPANQGQITIRIDGGPGNNTSNLLTAASVSGTVLQTTTLTTFENIPEPMRDAFEKDNMRPDITMQTSYSIATKGVLTPIQRTVKVSTLTGEAQLVANGFNINQATKQPTQKAPPLVKCSD